MNASMDLERLFAWLLQTTGQAAVIAVIILLAQALLRKRLSAAWRYGLWFLLIARLVMPVTPSSAVSIFNLAKWSHRQPATAVLASPSAPTTDVLSPVLAEPGEDRAQPAPAPQAQPQAISKPALTLPAMAAPAVAVAQPPAQPLDWMAFAASAWLVGAAVLMLRFFWSNHRFNRRLSRYPPVRDDSMMQLLSQCAELLRVTQRVQLVETREVASPAVYGLWRKRLLLPAGLRSELTHEQLGHVLLHELAHIKRLDLEVNWLIAILQLLHWFNPVLWFAFARMRADRELATDELALASSQQHDRSSYGETVLQVLEGLTQARVLPGLVGIGENKAQIKERIRAIARADGRPRWRWAAGAAAIAIAGITLTSARQDTPTNRIDLLKRYPTTLTAGDAAPGRARQWEFTQEDILQVSRFSWEVGKQLRVEVGVSDLGIGHCADGAVWAVLIPRDGGKLTSSVSTNQEEIAHVWLRFHPGQIKRLFPPETVSAAGHTDLEEQMRTIAETKIHSSWQAGGKAMIPELKDMTIDVDTKAGPRRFFVVDNVARTADYVAAFAGRSIRSAAQPVYEPEADTNCARVVSVSPANGSKDVESIQELRIRFDRPMNPYGLRLEWLAGGFQMNGSVRVEDGNKEFVIPLRLLDGQEHKLVLNRDRDREMWVAMGRRPEMKPTRSSRHQEGFLDANLVAANEFRWSFKTKAAAVSSGASKPRVVSVSPASGSTTPVLTLIEIVFDQPMRSPELTLPFLQKSVFAQGPSLIPSFDYDPAAHRVVFPALLRPDDDTRLTIRGFSSRDGVACDPVVLHYQAGSESLDASYMARAKAAAKDPALQKLLTSMKNARARLNSGIETVQTISLGISKNAYSELQAQTATFKWQGPNQVYADISGPMSMSAFILGSDGQDCWLYSVDEKGKKRLDRTPVGITEKELLLADPFYLQKRSVQEALGEAELVGASNAKFEGRPCYRLQKWNISQEGLSWAALTEWWIEEETFLPRQIVQYHPGGCQVVRFDYKNLNQSLPPTAFQAPAAATDEAQPLFFTKEAGPDEQRFLRISDGSNGRMSGRLGWHGPAGTTSSGLN